MFGPPLNKHWISFRRNPLGRPWPSIETRDDALKLGCLEMAYFFYDTWHKELECRLLLQCIRVRAKDQGSVRAKANSEFSREEVRFRTAHDELFNPSPSESVSVPGIEAKDDSTGGRGHSGRYYPHKSKW